MIVSAQYPCCLKRLVGTAILCAVVIAPACAEPVLDRALGGVRTIERKSCSIVKIEFNLRVQHTGHFPVERGTELRIALKAIDPAQAVALSLLKREALRAPAGSSSGITAIDFETGNPTAAELRITFKSATSYKVAQGADYQSIVVAVSGASQIPACKPEFPAGNNDWSPIVERAPQPPQAKNPAKMPARGKGTADAVETRQAAAWMDEARAALKNGAKPAAMKLLSRVLELPHSEFSADALELLAVTYQKLGNIDRARALYEDYLARYVAGEGADRIRQRLAGILTAQGAPNTSLKSSAGDGSSSSKAQVRPSTWNVSGSFSQFYIRDDSFRTLRDPSLPPDLNLDKDAHRVHQNVLLSSFDVVAAMNQGSVKSKLRFSGTEEHSFNESGRDLVAVAALNYETMFRDLDLTTRLGRQTRNSGGVLGRFDGAIASWQAGQSLRVNAVAGSPVERRSDAPFKDDKYFYGASIDFGPVFGGFETSLYAIEKRDRKMIDRQAIGTEVRYLQPDKSLFAMLDYDTHFNVINAAMLNSSVTFSDKSILTGMIDYRKAPFLSAWTALQGQPFLTLYDMMKFKTKEEIDQLAIDRTATYQSAMLGYSRPLTDRLQLNVDATVASVSGTIASGGVDAVLPQGQEFFASAQLIGNGLLTEGDMYIGALRYAHRPDADLYVLDLSTRYLMTPELRLNPRLRLGYQTGIGTDLKEVSAMPSLLLNYMLMPDLNFEFEIGAKWTRRDQMSLRETETDIFLTAGFRYDFYKDGQLACPKTNPACR